MSVVNNLDKLAEWADVNICQQVELKLPDDDATDATYPYKLVKPSAFVMYLPTKDRLPPNTAAPIPSLCVQIIEGTDLKNNGSVKVRFSFSAWNPGDHGKDIFVPNPASPGSYTQWNTEEARAYFKRTSDGWRDVWNFVDVALRAVESTNTIDCIRIAHEKGVSFGPFAEQGSVVDYYPYWYAWVSFTVEYGIIRDHKQYQDFL